MTLNGLHWLDGPWPGRLAVAARPRGGDWLEDDVARWKHAGVDAVVSLLTEQEERDLDLRDEAATVRQKGIEFISLPIPDRQVPSSEAEFAQGLEKISKTLGRRKSAVVHCRQGIGRSGLVAACLFVAAGLSPEMAVKKVSTARGVPVPETAEQREWIDHFAAVQASAK